MTQLINKLFIEISPWLNVFEKKVDDLPSATHLSWLMSHEHRLGVIRISGEYAMGGAIDIHCALYEQDMCLL